MKKGFPHRRQQRVQPSATLRTPIEKKSGLFMAFAVKYKLLDLSARLFKVYLYELFNVLNTAYGKFDFQTHVFQNIVAVYSETHI